ncbi:hypothetical protein H7U32_01095 [Bifidobacterium pullorum subsp. saeculare]|uniref:Plasmid replication, integration and excision activator n=1 Tax=Bifidobacterium pullorum subsp. saeculare TaxID=78257 RepID=A0A939B8Z5_9BIFI|nr:hypothetical protein [Bifidobacterium pullorum]MBM6698943.1 hypothetical protein [Bifidobacterium pullorum subsp. saeculare]
MAAQALGVGVEPVETYDPETRTRSQKTRDDGTPQWEVQVMLLPYEDDDRHSAAVVPVKVYAKTAPTITPLKPVHFVRLMAIPWAMEGRNGISYSADAVDTRPNPAGGDLK